jgi:hypothetical protein
MTLSDDFLRLSSFITRQNVSEFILSPPTPRTSDWPQLASVALYDVLHRRSVTPKLAPDGRQLLPSLITPHDFTLLLKRVLPAMVRLRAILRLRGNNARAAQRAIHGRRAAAKRISYLNRILAPLPSPHYRSGPTSIHAGDTITIPAG